MNKHIFLSLLICLFVSVSTSFAGELRDIERNLQKVNSLSIEMAQVDHDKEKITEVIQNHISTTVYNVNEIKAPTLKEIQRKFFTKNSFYPDFCHELTRKKNIRRCYKKLKRILKNTDNISDARYFVGDNSNNDFKYLFLVVTQEDQSLVLKFTIQDER